MKKIIITILVIIFSTNTYSQILNGTIKYKTTVGTDELFDKLDKKLREEYILEKEGEISLLKFDKIKSIFIIQNKIGNSQKIYYKEKDSLYSLRPENDQDFGKIIIIEEKKSNWVLHNETKLIDGFTCYKATSELIRNDGKFKFPVIAWYTPKIPLPFGPLGYGDLPGLILELQERNVVYGVEKMDFNIEKQEILLKPIKGRRITIEELSKKIRALYSKE